MSTDVPIAGVPTETALGWIREHEMSHSRLGGSAGWTDANGEGQVALAIRCLELDGLMARLVVGNGIVGGSEPDSEVLENQAKARGVLEAVTTL